MVDGPSFVEKKVITHKSLPDSLGNDERNEKDKIFKHGVSKAKEMTTQFG